MSDPGAPKKFEFDEPYMLAKKEQISGPAFWLEHDGLLVASFSVKEFGGDQECIEAAWNFAYRPSKYKCSHCGGTGEEPEATGHE